MEHLTSDLVFWITERYAIKERKESGMPRPWTADPIMEYVRFCNVHREDDRVTRWIRKNWNRGDDPAWKFVLGRMINLPESLASIAGVGRGLDYTNPFSKPLTTQLLSAYSSILKDRRYCGHKIFTSAYTISTAGKKMDKLDYVLDWVCADVPEPRYTSLKDTWEDLIKVDGLGSFLAAQVVADMKNTKGHPLYDAPDWYTWSAPGPGSLRGLGWYFNHSPDTVTASFYESHLRVCRSEVDPLIPSYIPRISDQDFQNCLCEFSKYCKVKYLNGHVRNRYVPYNPN